MGRLKNILLSGVNLLDRGVTDHDSWVQRMVQEYGQEIAVHLDDVFPQALAIQASGAGSRSAGFPLLENSLCKKPDVLIVDGVPNIVLSLKFLISQQGCEVRTAFSGNGALEAIREHVPDLVLMDALGTVPDGYEVCRRIRAKCEWKDIPVIILTEREKEVQRKRGLAVGVDDYLAKPFVTREIVTKVRGAFKAV